MPIILYLEKIKQALILIKDIKPEEAYKRVREARSLFMEMSDNDLLYNDCETILLCTEDAIGNMAGITLEDAANKFRMVLYKLPDEIKHQIVKPRY